MLNQLEFDLNHLHASDVEVRREQLDRAQRVLKTGTEAQKLEMLGELLPAAQRQDRARHDHGLDQPHGLLAWEAQREALRQAGYGYWSEQTPVLQWSYKEGLEMEPTEESPTSLKALALALLKAIPQMYAKMDFTDSRHVNSLRLSGEHGLMSAGNVRSPAPEPPRPRASRDTSEIAPEVVPAEAYPRLQSPLPLVVSMRCESCQGRRAAATRSHHPLPAPSPRCAETGARRNGHGVVERAHSQQRASRCPDTACRLHGAVCRQEHRRPDAHFAEAYGADGERSVSGEEPGAVQADAAGAARRPSSLRRPAD